MGGCAGVAVWDKKQLKTSHGSCNMHAMSLIIAKAAQMPSLCIHRMKVVCQRPEKTEAQEMAICEFCLEGTTRQKLLRKDDGQSSH